MARIDVCVREHVIDLVHDVARVWANVGSCAVFEIWTLSVRDFPDAYATPRVSNREAQSGPSKQSRYYYVREDEYKFGEQVFEDSEQMSWFPES